MPIAPAVGRAPPAMLPSRGRIDTATVAENRNHLSQDLIFLERGIIAQRESPRVTTPFLVLPTSRCAVNP